MIRKYTKRKDLDLLLQVSATTFAIFISLGMAIPMILAQSSEMIARLFTNGL